MASNFWYWPGAGKKDQVTGFGLRDVDLPVHISKIDRRPGHPDAEMVKNIGNKARAVKTKVRVGRACLIGGRAKATTSAGVVFPVWTVMGWSLVPGASGGKI